MMKGTLRSGLVIACLLTLTACGDTVSVENPVAARVRPPVEAPAVAEGPAPPVDHPSADPLAEGDPAPPSPTLAPVDALRRMIETGQLPTAPVELWTYEHENSTDNDIAEAIGEPTRPVPQPTRFCGDHAAERARRAMSELRADIMTLDGAAPNVACSTRIGAAVCDVTTTPHYMRRLVARTDGANGGVALWIVAHLGDASSIEPRDVTTQNRDFRAFVARATDEPCERRD